MSFFKFLIPRLSLGEFLECFRYAAIGAAIAASYGLLHDQITYSIGPEYFHKFKFHQFRDANLGFGDRVFVGTIGVLATWWVGAIVGWILARRIVPYDPAKVRRAKILSGFLIVFVTAILFGCGGYLYGLWRGPDADYSVWQPMLRRLHVSDQYRFMQVGYIHNAGYLGGAFGLGLTFLLIRSTKN